jgi:ribosomal-protein-alanine N-acetyltransferase
MRTRLTSTLRDSRLVIRPATCQDLESIVRIEQESFSAPWTGKMFEVELNQNPFGRLSVAHLCEGEDRVVGHVCFWVVFEELRLMNLAVAGSVRRHGIGRRLLQHAMGAGWEQGAKRALLEVRASNTPALVLYEQSGFIRKARRTNYYTNPVEDAVLMELESLEAAITALTGEENQPSVQPVRGSGASHYNEEVSHE